MSIEGFMCYQIGGTVPMEKGSEEFNRAVEANRKILREAHVVEGKELEAMDREQFLTWGDSGSPLKIDYEKIWTLLEWEKNFNITWPFCEYRFDKELAIKQLEEAGFSIRKYDKEINHKELWDFKNSERKICSEILETYETNKVKKK